MENIEGEQKNYNSVSGQDAESWMLYHMRLFTTLTPEEKENLRKANLMKTNGYVYSPNKYVTKKEVILEDNQNLPFGFTAREKQIADYLAEGKSFTQISGILNVGEPAIYLDLSHIYAKTKDVVGYKNHKKINDFLDFWKNYTAEKYLMIDGVENADFEVTPKPAYYKWVDEQHKKDGTVNPREIEQKEVVCEHKSAECEQKPQINKPTTAVSEQKEQIANVKKEAPKTLLEIVNYYNGIKNAIQDCDNLIQLYGDKKKSYQKELACFEQKRFQEFAEVSADAN